MTGIVHGAYKQLGGAVAAGQLVITVNTEGQVVRDPVGNVVFQGPQAVKLNKDGLVTLTLPASDDSTLEPSGFTYAIVEQLSHVARTSYRIVEFQVTNGGTVQLADLAATDEAALDPSYGANLNTVLAELDGRLSEGDLAASLVPRVVAQTAEQQPVESWSMQPFAAGKAPFSAGLSSKLFAGVYDPMFVVGYNVDSYIQGGGGGVPSEPALGMWLEADYLADNWASSGVPQRTMEWYVQVISADRATMRRPFAMTAGRDATWAATHIDIGTSADETLSHFNLYGGVSADALATFNNNKFTFRKPLYIERVLRAVAKATGGDTQAGYYWRDTSTDKWAMLINQGNALLSVIDVANGRNQVEYSPGASNTAAVSRFYSKVIAEGPLVPGHYTTAARPAASSHLRAVIFNDSTGKLEYSNGTNWLRVADDVVVP